MKRLLIYFTILILFVLYPFLSYSVDDPTNFSLHASDSQISLSWNLNLSNDSVLLVFNDTNDFDIPVNGLTYNIGNIFPSGAEVIYKDINNSFNHSSLTPNTWYYYEIWSFDAGHYYSTGLIDSIQTQCVAISSFPYDEYFESNGDIPNCWREEFVTGALSWKFHNGNPYSGYQVFPTSAFQGSYCAVLSPSGATSTKITKLISPKFDFSGIVGGASLSFRSFTTEGGTLKVYYKDSYSAPWVLLTTLLAGYNWVNLNINLPNLSDDYYIAFEGQASDKTKCTALDSVHICAGVTCCAVPPEPTISGTFNFCYTGVGSLVGSYSASSSGATSYEWAVCNGYLNSGQGTNSANIEFTCCGLNSYICVTPESTCGVGNSVTKFVCTTSPPGLLGNVVGDASPCVGETVTYTANAGTPLGCAMYSWAYPSDWTPLSNDETPPSLSITLIVGQESGNVGVITSSCDCAILCDSPIPPVGGVNVSPISLPSQPSAISGNTNPCEGTIINYSVNNVSGVNYDWVVPTGWIINSGQNTNQINVTVGPGSGDIIVTPSNTCGSGPSSNINVNVNPTSSSTDIQSTCAPFTWIDGNTYTSSINTPKWTLTNQAGCDSVVTLNLTILNNGSDTSAIACDSFDWYGTTYTSSGTPTHTFTNIAGCDSIVTLNLTIQNSDSTVDVISTCDSLTWIDGNTYTSSTNAPTWTLTNQASCDSVITLNLTVNQSYSGIDVVSACDSLTWIDGITYTSSTNIPVWATTGSLGCDSIIMLDLSINPNPMVNTIFGLDTVDLYQSELYYILNDSLTYYWDVVNGTITQQIANNVVQIQWDSLGIGHIYVLAENQYGCLSDTAIMNIIIGTTNLNLITIGNNVIIYPNPTNGTFSIKADDFIKVEILNSLGQKLLVSDKKKIDLFNLPSGIYYVNVLTDKGLTIGKIIKK